MIKISTYTKPKKNAVKGSTGGFSNTTVNYNGNLEPHYLWGNLFDGTQDVNGDIDASNSLVKANSINTKTLQAISAYLDNIISKNIENEGNLNVSGDTSLKNTTIDGNLNVSGDTNTTTITNSGTINTKDLIVTGSAHFFQLIIDKVKAAGGAVLITPADGFKVDAVQSIYGGYRLFFRSEDEGKNGKGIMNMWRVNDQAICKTFNRATAVGSYYQESNKNYWTLVTGVDDKPVRTLCSDGKLHMCHYIDVSDAIVEGTLNPEPGDEISMLGYRGDDDSARQSAIYLSAYQSIDNGLTAPLFAEYRGINDFNLSNHRYSYIDAHRATFIGNIRLQDGTTVEDYVKNNAATKAELEVTQNTINAKVESLENAVSGNTQSITQLQLTDKQINAKVDSLEKTVTGNTQSIANLEVTANGISGRVDTIIESQVNENLFPSNGWTNDLNEEIEPNEDMKYEYIGRISSPSIYLEKGTYCASSYNADSKQFVTSPSIQPDFIMESTETFSGATRYYIIFKVSNPKKYRFEYGSYKVKSVFYRPKLERGDQPTPYCPQSIHYSSLVEQTSRNISLKVIEGQTNTINQFKETGIDITNGKVEITADNTVINGNLKLNAKNNSDALTLYDENNIEKTTVTSQQIGKLSEQSQDTVQRYQKSFTVKKGQSTNFILDEKYFAANSVVKGGNAFTNSKVAYYTGTYLDENGNWKPQLTDQPSKCKIELILVNEKRETTYVIPQVQKIYGIGSNSLMSTLSTESLTIPIAGTYYIKARITWADGKTISPFAKQTRMSIEAYISAESPSKTLIASDGMYMTNGSDDFTYYGPTGFATSHPGKNNDVTTAISSVGAMHSNYDAATGKWEDEYTVGSGPSHIAAFKDASGTGTVNRWCNSQSYANMEYMYDATDKTMPHKAMPSSDVILFTASNTATSYLDISKAEFHGHMITIICPRGKGLLVMCSPTARFMYANGGGISSSNEHGGSYYVERMVFTPMGSGAEYNGLWIVI